MKLFVVISCLLSSFNALSQAAFSKMSLPKTKEKVLFKADSIRKLLTGITWAVHQNPVNKILLRKKEAASSSRSQTFQPCSSYLCRFICPSVSRPQWTGYEDENWFNADNWCTGVVPSANADVTISSSALHFPIISKDTVTVHDILIESDVELTLIDSGFFKISGAVTSNGLFKAIGGTVIYNGTSTQHIADNTFENNTVKNTVLLTIMFTESP